MIYVTLTRQGPFNLDICSAIKIIGLSNYVLSFIRLHMKEMSRLTRQYITETIKTISLYKREIREVEISHGDVYAYG